MLRKSFQRIANKYNTFLFDCDGVLWKQGKQINQGFEILNLINEDPKNKIFFISNNCARSREFIKDRLQGYGFKAEIDQIHLSSSLIAQNISQSHPNIKKVYAIGEEGLMTELENEGLQVVNSNIHDQESISVIDPANVDYMQDIDAIVIGHDKSFNAFKMMYVSNLLLQNKNMKLFTTESTLSYIKNQKNQQYIIPGVGTFLKCIELGLSRIPDYDFQYEMVAKPETKVLDIISKKYNINKREMIMIGDSIKTDIQMSRNYNIDSMLVFTGETTYNNFNKYFYSNIINDNCWQKYLKNNCFYIQSNEQYPIQQLTGL